MSTEQKIRNPLSADQSGIATEIRNIIEEYNQPEVKEITEPRTGVKALVIVKGNSVQPLPATHFDDYREEPAERTGTANFTAIESLIDHVNRFKDTDSALFAVDDRTKPSITAILNYHRAGAEGAPRFGGHRSCFAFPLSDEWKAWAQQDGKPLTMGEFAAFLEDRIIDVLDSPAESDLSDDLRRFVGAVGGAIATPNKLIELSVGLKVNDNSAVKQAVNLSTGEAQIQFVSEHVDDQGQPLKVPSLFLIGIPVFKNGPAYRIAARLRYRKTAEGLVFFYQLWRADRTFDHSFTEACERVRDETELPLLFGSPE